MKIIMKSKLALILFLVSFAKISFAQSPLVPIVDLRNKALLGGVRNGEWFKPENFGNGLDKETEFIITGWNGIRKGTVITGKRGQIEDVCDDFYRMNFETRENSGVAIGSKADWKIVPRIPQKISLKNAQYQKIVANFLKSKGIFKPVVKLTRAYKIDLDDDGKDEVVLAATNYRKGLDSEARPGNYSIILLRKIINGKVFDIFVTGDVIRKYQKFSAPNEYEVSAVADLNGDGKMEIIVFGQYYEGEFSRVYEFKDGKIQEIKEFSVECGV